MLPTVTAMSKVHCYEVVTVSGAPRSRSAAFILINEPLALLPRCVNTAGKVKSNSYIKRLSVMALYAGFGRISHRMYLYSIL